MEEPAMSPRSARDRERGLVITYRTLLVLVVIGLLARQHLLTGLESAFALPHDRAEMAIWGALFAAILAIIAIGLYRLTLRARRT